MRYFTRQWWLVDTQNAWADRPYRNVFAEYEEYLNSQRDRINPKLFELLLDQDFLHEAWIEKIVFGGEKPLLGFMPAQLELHVSRMNDPFGMSSDTGTEDEPLPCTLSFIHVYKFDCTGVGVEDPVDLSFENSLGYHEVRLMEDPLLIELRMLFHTRTELRVLAGQMYIDGEPVLVDGPSAPA